MASLLNVAQPSGRAPSERLRSPLGLLLIALLALSLGAWAGCGGDTPSDTTASPAPSTTVAPSTSASSTAPTGPTTTAPSLPAGRVSVYFALGEKIQPVHRAVDDAAEPARAAVEALLQGPTSSEQDQGLTTSVPEGTTLAGLTIADGVATIDLSREFEAGGGSLSMQMRLAQLVYTLTQFPTVSSVALKLDGTPVTALGGEGVQTVPPRSRADYEDLTPAILVEEPALGDTVTSPLTISGTANTFEAAFRLEMTDWDGRIVAEEQVMATAGTGTRGTFETTIDFAVDLPGNGALIVFEDSPQDGSRINLVEIPLKIEK